jgi:hypothetical protein
MTVPAKAQIVDPLENALIDGDLSKLSVSDRVRLYNETCKSLGINPLTKPFGYITLNGKLTLYAMRACTDQLRKINNVSLEIVSRDVADGILTVHVRAKMPHGTAAEPQWMRVDEDLGSVAFPDTLKGEARANQELKCVTKAKRRVTLSICGLGWLDETEVDIPASAKQPVAKPDAMRGTKSPPALSAVQEATVSTSAVASEAAPPDKLTPDQVAAISIEARDAADRGSEIFQAFWKRLDVSERAIVQGMAGTLRTRMDEADRLAAAAEGAEG